MAVPPVAPGGGGHCTGCGRPAAECPGCGGPSDPWRYCPDCGGWLAVQVTPAGWRSTCRRCGAAHRATH